MTPTALRDRTGTHQQGRRRRAQPVRERPAPRVETWGDMRMRHRREHHEGRVRTAEALNDLDQALRRADRWCHALELRLEREERVIAKARAELTR